MTQAVKEMLVVSLHGNSAQVTPVKAGGISVCMIVKNCKKELKDCLESLTAFIDTSIGDEIVVVDTGSTDGTCELAEQYGASVFRHPELCDGKMLECVKKHTPELYEKYKDDSQFEGGFIRDFTKAREISCEHAKNELIFWIDSDDVLHGGSKLRKLAKEYFSKPVNKVMLMQYDYGFDEDGTCITVQWRERILRKHEFEWRGSCHESMVPKDGTILNGSKVLDPDVKIVHKNSRHHLISDVRNFAVMLEAYQSSEWKDPRLELYLGNACWGLGRPKESIRWHGLALLRSGSRDDRYLAALNIGYNLIALGRPWRALDSFFQATKINTDDPRAFFGIARAYYDCKKWQACLIWTNIGRGFPPPNTFLGVDPTSLDFWPAIFECKALKELGQSVPAMDIARALLSSRPTFEPAKVLYKEIQEWAEGDHIKALVQATTSLAFSEKARQEIILRIRPELRRQYRMLQVETTCHSEKSIAFLCPGGLPEHWDTTSLETGLGGSERMVVEMSRALAKRGWTVDVYARPKEENLYQAIDGVIWRPYEAFNTMLKRDIVVFWRNMLLTDLPVRANKVFLDMHDMPCAKDWTDLRMNRLNGIFWKSKFQRSQVPHVPEAKCIYSRNGIDLSLFEEKVERNPKKIIWCSSGDRGLQAALAGYAELRRDVQDAEFHVFYGFTDYYKQVAANVEYEFMGDFQCERHMYDYMEETMGLIESTGALFHGRVGAKELARHMLESSVWLYPTRFPEISCISAMEAQAAGCLPVCSDFGALKETVDYGTVIDPDRPDQMANAIRTIFEKGSELDAYRKQMQEWARKQYNLEDLAEAWEKEFLR